jgi:hypothetical protein
MTGQNLKNLALLIGRNPVYWRTALPQILSLNMPVLRTGKCATLTVFTSSLGSFCQDVWLPKLGSLVRICIVVYFFSVCQFLNLTLSAPRSRAAGNPGKKVGGVVGGASV